MVRFGELLTVVTPRSRLPYAVLALHLRAVDIRAGAECDGQVQGAVHRGGRRHVQHVLAADDGLLQWSGYGVRHYLRVRTRVMRVHHDRWRHYFRVLTD